MLPLVGVPCDMFSIGYARCAGRAYWSALGMLQYRSAYFQMTLYVDVLPIQGSVADKVRHVGPLHR